MCFPDSIEQNNTPLKVWLMSQQLKMYFCYSPYLHKLLIFKLKAVTDIGSFSFSFHVLGLIF